MTRRRPLFVVLCTSLAILGCDPPEPPAEEEPDQAACTEGVREPAAQDTGCFEPPPPEPEPELEPGTVREREVDLLLVVDNSWSMGTKQRRLAQSMDALVSAFASAEPPVDLRVGVTTTDNGNPWCRLTTPEAGQLVGSGCHERLDSFVVSGDTNVDVRDSACLEICARESLELDDPWVDVAAYSPAESGELLRCLVPQGIDGCGFEQPLMATSRALERATENGFHRPTARLAVILVTDEADCSHNQAQEWAFLAEGDRALWSDPTAIRPTSAVCWNAGVRCSGDPSALDCMVADRTATGEAAADPEHDAVLYPVSRFIEQLEAEGAMIMAIDGVAADGSVRYREALDPRFGDDFGIEPGCRDGSDWGLPPVRIHKVIESVSGAGMESSVCASDYAPAMTGFARRIIESLPQ